MAYFVPNKKYLHEILIHYYNMGKNSSESHRILAEVYGDVVPTEQYCQKSFEQFKCGNFDFEYVEQAEVSKMVEDCVQPCTSKKIKEKNEDASNLIRPKVFTREKKAFLRKVLLYYYDMKKKNIGFGESKNYFVKIFGNLDRAEQMCRGFIKHFKSGNLVFENEEQSDMLKKNRRN